jgi:hypothetical protein
LTSLWADGCYSVGMRKERERERREERGERREERGERREERRGGRRGEKIR